MGKLTLPTDGSSKFLVYKAYHKQSESEIILLGLNKKDDIGCVKDFPPYTVTLSKCRDIRVLRQMTVEEYHYRRNKYGYRWDDTHEFKRFKDNSTLENMSADEFEAEVEWIIEAKAEGYSWNQLAKKYGVSAMKLKKLISAK